MPVVDSMLMDRGNGQLPQGVEVLVIRVDEGIFHLGLDQLHRSCVVTVRDDVYCELNERMLNFFEFQDGSVEEFGFSRFYWSLVGWGDEIR